MKILLSNDDGVYAPGLACLAKSLGEIAEIDVVAPDRERSGVSNALTLDRPLRIKTAGNGFMMVDGTPTDCVHLAITGFLHEEPDMVVAGINAGANLGDDVLYSGTVAAATEGRFLGLPAIAISLVGKENKYYETAALVARRLIEQIQQHPIPSDTILNVNVPDVPFEEIKGFEITRLGHRHKAEPILEALDPRDRKIYWIGPPGKGQDAHEGTDFYAISRNKVSITPLEIDLTRYASLESLAHWSNGLKL